MVDSTDTNGWEGSHGRDNLIHLYHPYKPIHGVKDEHPKADRSLDVNALNFCRFSLAPLLGNGKGKAKEKEAEALLAVPNLIDSGLADIYHLPSMRRLHSSVNASLATSSTSRPAKVDPKGARSGLIMSLHLRFLDSRLALAMGLEDGRVELWTCALKDGWEGSWDSRLSEERRWKKVSEGKGHNEAGQSITPESSRLDCTIGRPMS
jgi:hypothetical protein